jgi:hypothetical protein
MGRVGGAAQQERYGAVGRAVSGSFFCRRRSDLAQVVDAISGEGDDAVDPKATVFRVHVAAEHIEIASMRIAPELLLDLQCQTVHAPPHVGVPTASHSRTPDGTGIIAATTP